MGGLNCETAYNDASRAELINSDSGVFYTVGNTAQKGSVIHHNWFHDSASPSYSSAKAAGIYLDNDSKGYVVHHNVIWNVSWSGFQVNWANWNIDFFNNTIWNAGGAMDSWVNGRVQQDNRIYNNFASTGDWFRGTGFDIQNNIIAATSPFEDVNNLNFMPKSGTSLIDSGRLITGFVNPYKGSAPDLGAYERGGTAWTAGINAIIDTGESLDVQEFFNQKNSLALYPNPASNEVNIPLDTFQNLDDVTVKVYSLLGSLVQVNHFNLSQNSSSVVVPVQNLAVGTYLVRMFSKNTIYNGKFIKK